MTGPAPQRDEILVALERLLAWPEIVRSPQLGRFLEYIVSRTLDGNKQSIKAYSIAVDVLGRSDDFDPQADPIVRVQARRLRGLLEEYYRGAGLGETVRFALPVGRYVPEFIAADQTPEIQTLAPVVEAEAPPMAAPVIADAPPRPAKTSMTLLRFAVAVIAIGLAAYALSTWEPHMRQAEAAQGAVRPPSVSIGDFQDLTGDTAGTPLAAGLAIELITDLGQFEDIDARYVVAGQTEAAAAHLATSDYMLAGIVRRDGNVIQYSAILTETRTGAVVWSNAIPIASAAAASGALDDVSRQLSLVLGSPRGPLHAAARAVITAGAPIQGGYNTYLCRVWFDLYRETRQASDARQAHDCLAALPEVDRQAPQSLAAAASLLAENAVLGNGPVLPIADRQRIAELSLDRAIARAPVSAFIWEQRARLHEAMGAFELARADYGSSIQLNPASADALAAFARLLALSGKLAQAETMALDAVDRSPNPPPWYHGVPALLNLRDGDYLDAVRRADLYAQADREIGPILSIMAGQGAADSTVVNRYLPEVLDQAAFRSQGVMTRLRERITDQNLLASMQRALLRAGVPNAALTGPF